MKTYYKIFYQFRNSKAKALLKFQQHIEYLKKQFLFDDLESIASSSIEFSEPRNPLSLKLGKNKFIEDLYEKPFKTEEAEIIRVSDARKSKTKELCQNYFDEKFLEKLNIKDDSKKECFFFFVVFEKEKKDGSEKQDIIINGLFC